MGVTRLDYLPENRVREALLESRRVSSERKGSPQRVSGSNLAYHVNETANTFDWSGRLEKATGSGTGYEKFYITLVSETAVVPLVGVAITLFYSTDGVTWQEYTYQRGQQEAFTGVNPQIVRFLEPLQGADVVEKTSVYFLSLYGQANARVAFKVQAPGVDVVTIGVTRLSA